VIVNHYMKMCLKSFMTGANDISHFGLPEADGMPALRPFNVVHNSDMKAAWYLSGRGGGCKSTNFLSSVLML
jgi:hypothetical protein